MLTYQEYTDFGGTLGEDEFHKLLPSAHTAIRYVTNKFYDYHDLETDYPFRKQAYKEAIAHQIHYFNETQKTSYEALNNVPQSVTLGRTTISQGGRYGNTSNNVKSIVCHEALLALAGTGLMNRGVC